MEGNAVLDVLEGVDELLVAKGKKILRYNLKDERPADADLMKLLLGRSGKLRAPAMRRGGQLMVGYNQALLAEALND